MNNSQIKNTFYCPYCRGKKNKSELEYKTEVGNFRSSPEMVMGRPNLYKIKFDKYQVPICSECSFKHEQASKKANIISFALFVIIFLTIFYHSVKSNFQNEILVPSIFAALLCLLLRWLIKFIIIKRYGIRNHVSSFHYELECNWIEENAKIAKMKESFLMHEEEERKRIEDFHRSIEKWKEKYQKHNKFVTVDMGNGKKGVIGISVKPSDFKNEEELPSKKENMTDTDYYDDDCFYGGFV